MRERLVRSIDSPPRRTRGTRRLARTRPEGTGILLCVLSVLRGGELSALLQIQARERRDPQPHRLIESVRRDRLAVHAAAVADAAAAVDLAIGVQDLRVVTRIR